MGGWRQAREHQVWSAVIAGLILTLILGCAALASRAIKDLTPLSKTDSSSEVIEPGWGPNRPVYPCENAGGCKGGNHVSLDSTVNTPAYGDERFFLSAKIEGDVGGVKDLLEVEPGDIIQLRIIVANDGDPNVPHSLPLLARGVTARVELPRDPADEAQIVAWLSADNASPQQIYDSLRLISSDSVGLHFVGGSAVLRNSAHSQGLPLPDSLFEEGALLGYRRLDGRLDTCFCHLGIVLAKVVVTEA
jgi:hypothetical protein